MPQQIDLDEVAEAFFSVRAPDRPEYARLLIRARDRAVFPLLRGFLARIDRFEHYAEDLAHESQDSIFGEEFGRLLWAKSILEPKVHDVYDIVRRIGEPAKAELCRALLGHDDKVRLVAAYLLSMDESPSEETQHGIQKAIRHIGADQKQALVLMLLGLVLAQVGDTEWRQAIESHARDNNLNFEEWRKRTIDSVLIKLQRT